MSGGQDVKKVIEKDPQFVVDAIEKMYREKQQKEQQERTKKAPEIAKQLENRNNTVLGNKKGKKVIVEFFDYACGHCKREAQELHKVIQQDKDVKVVLADMAIMSQHSLTAAQVGIYIGLYNPEKLEKYYLEMSKSNVDPQSIKKVLSKIGVKEDTIKKSAESSKVKEILESNFNAAREIGLQGTPALIVNGKFIPGMITADDIISILK